MVWQLKCNTIVMLTDIMENGKIKCVQYWPDEENTESFGTIQVTHISTGFHATYIHRRFIISKTGAQQNESWTIDHFFFNKWPDHGIPQHTEYILEFRNALRFREGTTSSLIVHCSAGVGRTGTYICIDILLNEMLTGESVDVLASVTKLREERVHMVQKRIQLEFIYDVLVENILTGDYDINVNNISKEFSRIKETDHSTRVSILEHQFQIFKINFLENNWGFSFSEIEGEYANFNISGVFIDGPFSEKELFVTKSPNENDALEFLRCMRKRGYLNIVAFDSSEETPTYLPRTLNETVKIGPYLLELINVEGKDVCIHRVLKVEFDNNSRIEEFEINHFQVTIWADGNYPSCAEILQLSDILSAHQNEQFNKKIAVYCSKNFHKSGLLCIIHILKDAITSQSVINIVRLVRLIKKIEPNIIPDCESYAFIWEVAAYLQNESSLYANFVQ
ncbi:receptor-type tyrosine-protein phosphatase kappa [Octopus bimaculoides]|uniref:receptor-type tyrosine-protein phosphatase kappa n=1 Tax=Octopus bimaculoides TaxID=37653 RepID=UPI0022E6FEF1|nr:receptor-type tyrosine-protein phosphatase kappa [Octopus bimaculoides]